MSDDRYELTTHGGKVVDKYTDWNLREAEKKLGYDLTIVQGSYHKGVGASAGTHDGGGAVDLLPWDWQNKVRVLRELGFAAWHRPAIRGVWSEHIHAVLIGNAKASSSAKAQVLAYKNGRDGLRSNRPDYFWRPTIIRDAAYKGKQTEAVVDPIEWAKWKVTLPVGSAGKPTETKSDVAHRPWYGRDPEDRNWLMFRANCGGVTTSGSKYPRSELRELSGGKLAAWSNSSGTHTLTGTFKVTHLPVAKPHVVCAQIHDADDDIIEVRVEGKRLFLEGDGTDLGTLDANYTLGTVFDLTITAAKGGITVTYRRGSSPAVSRSRKGSWSGLYFKAGCYTQSNTSKGDKASAYGEVGVKNLRVRHA